MKYPIKIASAMAAYYAVTGVYQNYISKYFGAQGLTDGIMLVSNRNGSQWVNISMREW